MDRLIHGTLVRDGAPVVVIMAGGHGTRFWPASRRRRPKQFLPLADGEKTLIQATAERVSRIAKSDHLLVVTSIDHVPLLSAQLPEVSYLAEPSARNTAPCVLMAALKVLNDAGDVPMVCLPADHFIQDDAAFCEILSGAIKVATNQDALVTVGIPPTCPETGYGYILSGEMLDSVPGVTVNRVSRFVEKPSREKAMEFLADGRFFWNSGMFIWRPSVILRAIERHLPELWSDFSPIRRAIGTNEQDLAFREVYQKITGISIDHGVMEKVSTACVIRGSGFTWSDVGSWSAWSELRESLEPSALGNVTVGDAILIGTKGCSVLGMGGQRVVAAVGVEDLVIVDTEDAVLVAKKDRAQDVKKVVEALGDKRRIDLL